MALSRCEDRSAAIRLSVARDYLATLPGDALVWVIATRRASARAFLRGGTARFGAEPMSTRMLIRRLATDAVVGAGLAFPSAAACTALAARVINESDDLGAYAAVASTPGLARSLAQLSHELRDRAFADGRPRGAELLGESAPDLRRLVHAYEEALERERFADEALALRLATDALGKLDDVPAVVLLDPDLRSPSQARLVHALEERAVGVCTVAPRADSASAERAPTSDLDGVRARLFRAAAPSAALGDGTCRIFSAAGESAECVEIARRILRAADHTPFERMAVVLHAPRYRAPLQSALRRAKVPFALSQGTRRPDPSGRAFLALLECAARDCSAHAFADYLAFGAVPDRVSGAPPVARERFVVDAENYGSLETQDEEDRFQQSVADDPYRFHRALRVPRRFEQLLVDAAVIGGRARWERRLSGLRARYAEDGPALEELENLRAFALPLLDELSALPEGGTWGDWQEALSRLASRAIHAPERILEVLQSLSPMAEVGPVSLSDVQQTLSGPLGDLRIPSFAAGAVQVLSTDEARGHAFDEVFIPGLAEKLWPAPMRAALLTESLRKSLGLEHRAAHMAWEKSALLRALSMGTRATLSWPRVDVSTARLRVPSTLLLSVYKARDGSPRVRDEVHSGDVPLDEAGPLIDVAEYDGRAAERAETPGELAYMLDHGVAARALRRRAGRWDTPKWTASDGFVGVDLSVHRISARAYSPTGLQRFAACPYQFGLAQHLRLAPREVPTAIDRLDPRDRGSLVHTIQFRVLEELRMRKLLPLDHPSKLSQATLLLREITQVAADEKAQELKPAIDRVWFEGIQEIETDLRRWLRELEPGWEPTHFELAFGLPKDREQDSASVEHAVELPSGLRLRGAIDLVETHAGGARRATDHKTGRDRHKASLRIGGGETLQPALYAMVLDALLGNATVGRLHFCTHRGAFRVRDVTLDRALREDVAELSSLIDGFLAEGFLPAHPAREKSCTYCDYRIVCGPSEFERTRSKSGAAVKRLNVLRGKP